MGGVVFGLLVELDFCRILRGVTCPSLLELYSTRLCQLFCMCMGVNISKYGESSAMVSNKLQAKVEYVLKIKMMIPADR